MTHNLDSDSYSDDDETYTQVDNLIDAWSEFVTTSIPPIRVVTEKYYDTGTICNLRDIILDRDLNEFEVIPKLQDIYYERLSEEYSRYIEGFLKEYGITLADVGEDESIFAEIFYSEVSKHVVVNTWDLWRKKGKKGGDCSS